MHYLSIPVSKKWPYCMKKKRARVKCTICGKTRDKLLGKTMPGLYKGKCHRCYVLKKKYRGATMAQLVRAKINLSRMVHGIA